MIMIKLLEEWNYDVFVIWLIAIYVVYFILFYVILFIISIYFSAIHDMDNVVIYLLLYKSSHF